MAPIKKGGKKRAAAPTLPIFDGHNDFLLAAHGWSGEPRSFFEHGEVGHLDLPRALDGGFAGGFFAVYAPAESAGQSGRVAYSDGLAAPLDASYALRISLTFTALLFRLAAASKGRLRVVRNMAELTSAFEDKALAAILHYEGAEAIDPQLNVLEVLYAAGLRSLGLVWSRPNIFAQGVPFGLGSPDTGPGLTMAGRNLVNACNQLGVLVDLSHLNQQGFWDVAEISSAPLVATHSNAYALSPVTRNLTDEQIDAIAESGGLIGVNFSVAFTRADGEKEPDTPLAELARHFAYIADRVGVEHVAFGSDFDGTTVPTELGDAAGLPRLVDELRKMGFDDKDLKKMGTRNWLRVLAATWRKPGA
jgi:membrane dipeptidase